MQNENAGKNNGIAMMLRMFRSFQIVIISQRKPKKGMGRLVYASGIVPVMELSGAESSGVNGFSVLSNKISGICSLSLSPFGSLGAVRSTPNVNEPKDSQSQRNQTDQGNQKEQETGKKDPLICRWCSKIFARVLGRKLHELRFHFMEANFLSLADSYQLKMFQAMKKSGEIEKRLEADHKRKKLAQRDSKNTNGEKEAGRDFDRICKYCGTEFYNHKGRRRHQLRRHFSEVLEDSSADYFVKSQCIALKSLNISCTVCHKYFPDKESLKKHGYLCRNITAHKCRFCEKELRSKQSRLAHELALHEAEFYLSENSEVSKTLRKLEPFYCQWCSAQFKSKRSKILHEWRAHRETENFYQKAEIIGLKNLPKPSIDLETVGENERLAIVKAHYDQFGKILETKSLCRWCGQRCFDTYTRQNHELRFHSGEVDFDEYTDIPNWHERLTMLLKDWTCRWCMVQFADKQYRQKHELLAHGHLPNFEKLTDIRGDWRKMREILFKEWEASRSKKFDRLESKITKQSEQHVKRKKRVDGHYKTLWSNGPRGSPTYVWTNSKIDDVIVEWVRSFCPSGKLEDFNGGICIFDAASLKLPKRLKDDNLKHVSLLQMEGAEGHSKDFECDWKVHNFSAFCNFHSSCLKLGDQNGLSEAIGEFSSQKSWQQYDDCDSVEPGLIFVGVLNQNQYSFFLSVFFTAIMQSLIFSRGPVELLVFVDSRIYALLTGMEGKPELLQNKIAKLRHQFYQLLFQINLVHKEPLESFQPTFGIMAGTYRGILNQAGISDKHLYLLHIKPKRECELKAGDWSIARTEMEAFYFFSEILVRPRSMTTRAALVPWFGNNLDLNPDLLALSTKKLSLVNLMEIFVKVVRSQLRSANSNNLFLSQMRRSISSSHGLKFDIDGEVIGMTKAGRL